MRISTILLATLLFTGIIEAVGKVVSLECQEAGARLCVNTGTLEMNDARRGDSIAVNGVCLTVTDLLRDGFWADISAETLSCTTFARLCVAARVNLERSLKASARLGGHWVSGHVDGVGTVNRVLQEGAARRLRIALPAELCRYIAVKGSICVDGVSLTVNAVKGREFEVTIIPHTLQATSLGEFQAGHQVNLEVDIIARYLERLLLGEGATDD